MVVICDNFFVVTFDSHKKSATRHNDNFILFGIMAS